MSVGVGVSVCVCVRACVCACRDQKEYTLDIVQLYSQTSLHQKILRGQSLHSN